MIDALINRIAREISSFSSRSSRRLLIIFRANEPFCRALITAEKALLPLLLLFQSSNLTIHDEDIEREERRVFASFCSPFISKRSSSSSPLALAASALDSSHHSLAKKCPHRRPILPFPNPMFINDAAAAA